MDIHSVDLLDGRSGDLVIGDGGSFRCGNEVPNGVEQETSGSARRIEYFLVQVIFYGRFADPPRQPVGRVILAEIMSLLGVIDDS
jgi:hypothetical protein